MISKTFRGLSLLVVAALPLSGCTAVWGKSYNVAMSNSKSVVVEYDPLVVDMSALSRAAQTECAKYKKDAVFDKESTSNLGIKVNTYKCE